MVFVAIAACSLLVVMSNKKKFGGKYRCEVVGRFCVGMFVWEVCLAIC